MNRQPDYVFKRRSEEPLIVTRVEWFIDPPRRRTIRYKRRYIMLDFPYLVYGKLYHRLPLRNQEFCGGFVVLGSRRKIGKKTKLRALNLPHGSVFGHYCMDFTGKEDPIEKFWNSGFVHHSEALINIAKWNRRPFHKNTMTILTKSKECCGRGMIEIKPEKKNGN